MAANSEATPHDSANNAEKGTKEWRNLHVNECDELNDLIEDIGLGHFDSELEYDGDTKTPAPAHTCPTTKFHLRSCKVEEIAEMEERLELNGFTDSTGFSWLSSARLPVLKDHRYELHLKSLVKHKIGYIQLSKSTFDNMIWDAPKGPLCDLDTLAVLLFQRPIRPHPLKPHDDEVDSDQIIYAMRSLIPAAPNLRRMKFIWGRFRHADVFAKALKAIINELTANRGGVFCRDAAKPFILHLDICLYSKDESNDEAANAKVHFGKLCEVIEKLKTEMPGGQWGTEKNDRRPQKTFDAFRWTVADEHKRVAFTLELTAIICSLGEQQ